MIFIPEISNQKNAVIEGENIEIMKALLEQGFKDSFHMIYLDGPFNSGLLFSVPQQEFGFEYIYPWSQFDSVQNYFNIELYLKHYKKRIELAKQLLREDGIIVLQTNMLCGHHLKVLLDGILGRENFQSEVIWKHSDTPWPNMWGFPVGYQHETILFYSKSSRFTERLESDMVFPSVWDDIKGYQYSQDEDTNYPSQKPEKLIERILDIATKKGDLIGDFYCGSGTLAYVAEKKQRRWLACDNSPLSIQITKKRLGKIGGKFESYYTLDEFEPSWFNHNEYVKRTLTPISAQELHHLSSLNHHVKVSAYSYLPDVDLLNEKRQFTFHYIFPLVTADGFSDSQTIEIARPIPVKDKQGIRLVVPNELEWIMHHMVFVEQNHLKMLNISKYDKDYKHIFKWDETIHRAKEIVNQIKGNWIVSAVEQDGLTTITDLFGYKYAVPNK